MVRRGVERAGVEEPKPPFGGVAERVGVSASVRREAAEGLAAPGWVRRGEARMSAGGGGTPLLGMGEALRAPTLGDWRMPLVLARREVGAGV